MAIERTFSIIKPDATRRNLTGKINAVFEEAGLRVVGQKRIQRAAGEQQIERLEQRHHDAVDARKIAEQLHQVRQYAARRVVC